MPRQIGAGCLLPPHLRIDPPAKRQHDLPREDRREVGPALEEPDNSFPVPHPYGLLPPTARSDEARSIPGVERLGKQNRTTDDQRTISKKRRRQKPAG